MFSPSLMSHFLIFFRRRQQRTLARLDLGMYNVHWLHFGHLCEVRNGWRWCKNNHKINSSLLFSFVFSLLQWITSKFFPCDWDNKLCWDSTQIWTLLHWIHFGYHSVVGHNRRWSENSHKINSLRQFSPSPMGHFMIFSKRLRRQTLVGLHLDLNLASPASLLTPQRGWTQPMLVRKQLQNQLSVVIFSPVFSSVL